MNYYLDALPFPCSTISPVSGIKLEKVDVRVILKVLWMVNKVFSINASNLDNGSW